MGAAEVDDGWGAELMGRHYGRYLLRVGIDSSRLDARNTLGSELREGQWRVCASAHVTGVSLSVLTLSVEP